MPKKNTGGKKFKSQKKDAKKARELIFKEDEQSYARITKSLGDSRFECECFDLNETIIGLVRGSFKKKIWMRVGDIVLISLRDFDKTKCDIIHKYLPDEAKTLKSYGELPDNLNLHATALDIYNDDKNSSDDLGFDFDEI